MREKKLLWVFILIGFSAFSQIKGIVVDENDKPISYVNIWVENENIGTTSEENGIFSINLNGNKNLIFSALGYEKKTLKSSEVKKVVLIESAFKLDEVVISNSIGTKQIIIGQNSNAISQAFDNGPRIDVKYFPYIPTYKKTKFIKKVVISTDSNIENATIRIHFYSVDSNGFPGDELLKKDFLVSIKKGLKNNRIDLADFDLIMPKKGLFVGFEKLIIESNKLEKTITDSNTNKTQTKITYYPFVLYNYVERNFLFTFSGGKWNKKTEQTTNNSPGKIKVYEPAINLILSN